MILLDTHIWLWWVHEDERLPRRYAGFIEKHVSAGLGVSVISCWEVAKLLELKRIGLPHPPGVWVRLALTYLGIRLVNLTPEIAVEATRLPTPFNCDPADQLLVATARILKADLLTVDRKILDYPHVPLARP